MEIAKIKGARLCVELNVSGAFHSPLMKPARRKLKEAIEKSSISDALFPVYANFNSKQVIKKEDIKSSLIEQLEHPVLWSKSIMSMENIGCEIDYINPHATSTPIGDEKEVEAIRETFGSKIPNISATKSLTGHSLGAAGVQEAIYSILMMQNDFIAKSANIENIDPKFEDLPINKERIDNANIGCLLSNSFGFGGTNASLVFKNPNL